ncbi:MAG: glycosyltransferase family 39 protein, partial [Thermoanaerobaculia bacterium]
PRGFVVAMVFIALLPALLLPFYPPTVPDSTVYHLPLAKAFLEEHQPTYVESLRFPVFPLLSETLFATAMDLTSDVGAQLVHCLQMLLTALLMVAWGRRLCSRRGGLWAAALWLGTPLVVWIGAAAYVDLGLALFVTAAIFTWEIRVPGDPRGLWMTGAFAGFAAGTKYLGLLFVAGLGLLALIEAIRHRRPAVFAAVAAAAVVALAPWYGWIYSETGNPVFPFYSQLFGDSELQTAIDRGRTAASELKRIATAAVDLLRVPWDAVFRRQVFGHQAPSSPLLVLLLPTAGLLAWRRPDTRRLLCWVAAYGLFWAITVRDLRFLLPVLPALAVALTVALDRAAGRRRQPSPRALAVSWLVAGILLAPGIFYAGLKLGERGLPPTDAAARRNYLLERVPEYAAIDYLNHRHGDSYTVYGLSRPRLHYYAAGRFLGSRRGPFNYRKVRGAFGDSRELHRRLTSFGADYLLFVETPASGSLPRDPAFAELFTPALERDGFALYRLAEEAE